MSVGVHHGDCREIIPSLGVTVDAVVCDPPYHLVPNAKRWAPGRTESADVHDGRYRRLSGGFMGQVWDGGDVAFQPETWRVIGETLKPGGFLVAFGSTRGYHRMAYAIEDAGFVIQDCLMWLFATGFPKRRDMLKPAFEPLVLAYKPGGKRTLQVDECRIGTTDEVTCTGDGFRAGKYGGQIGHGDATLTGQPWKLPASGRWPANICHDGSDEVVGLFPQSAGSVGEFRRVASKGYESTVQVAGRNQDVAGVGYGDDGSAARFFFSAKAGTQDRWGSRHPTVKPVELMKWLVALVTPPGGVVLDPFAGSGTTGVAALATGRDCILIEREDQYVADIRERLAFYEGGGTHSVQAKNRNRKVDHGPLFDVATAGCEIAETPLPNTDESYDPEVDQWRSWWLAHEEIGERVKRGGEVPEFMKGKP